MKRLLVILSALLLIIAVSCSNDTLVAPSAGLDGTDITITVPTVDEDSALPDEYSEIVGVIMREIGSSLTPSVSDEKTFESGYDYQGNKIYSYEDGVYTIGVDCEVLKTGDEVEYVEGSSSYITVNGTEYLSTSDQGAAYISAYDTIMHDLLKTSVTSTQNSSVYRRVKLNGLPVLDDEGKKTFGEDGITPVEEDVRLTVRCLGSSVETTTSFKNTYKTEKISKTVYELDKAVSGITSVTIYTSTTESSILTGGDNSFTSSVIEITRNGETSAYVY